MSRMEEGVIKVVPTQMAHSSVHAHLTSHWHQMADHAFHMQAVVMYWLKTLETSIVSTGLRHTQIKSTVNGR